MIKDITIGQFIKGDSFIHRLDPRSKITAVFLIMVGLFLAKSPVTITVVYSVSFFIMFLSQVPIKRYLKGIKPLWFILLFTGLMQLFFVPGEVLWSYGVFKITHEGVAMAFYMCSRLMLLVMVTSVLTLTTTPIDLTNGIEAILKPFEKVGVPAHALAMMMSIALRFIPTLIDETEKIIKAQSARGADFESGNLVTRAKALLPILVPLFLSALKRADDLALAMEARCYRGGEGRTKLNALVFYFRDYFSIAFAGLFLGVMIILWVMGI